MRNNEIESVKVTQILPIVLPSGHLERQDTAVSEVHFLKGINLYKLSYTYLSWIEDSLTETGIRYHHLLYRPGDKFGYDLDSSKSVDWRKISIDSTKKGEPIFNINLSAVFNGYDTIAIHRSWNGDNSKFQEMYKIRYKADTSISGSIYLEFSKKFIDLPFSIAPKLDSLKRMKLMKAVIFSNPRYIKKFDVHVGKLESSFILEKWYPENPGRIAGYFKKFQKLQDN